jgi:hypothetical protein
MQLKTETLEQHIAVFGESGSGKTVLVSSFYGATQEPDFWDSSLFTVTADDTGLGHQLHANYLGMKDARRPETTRFSSTTFSFLVRLRDKGASASGGAKAFDAVRLVWHDYPGEWFEEEVSDPEVAQRRIVTFKSLLGSDVAFLLVDGQRLLENAGEEERYLKSLFGSFRTGLMRLEDQLLEDGRPLVRFPRIWILALSKADLLPDLDVFGFRDLIVRKASADLGELRRVLEGLVDSPTALTVGEDYVRFSSAKFEPNKIEVSERIGLDLILPIASILPFQRHIRWVERKQLPPKVAEGLLNGAAALAAALVTTAKFAGVTGRLLSLVGRSTITTTMSAAAKLGGEQLKKLNVDARNRHDHLAEVLTRFGLDLERGEEDRVLLRSRR